MRRLRVSLNRRGELGDIDALLKIDLVRLQNVPIRRLIRNLLIFRAGVNGARRASWGSYVYDSMWVLRKLREIVFTDFAFYDN